MERGHIFWQLDQPQKQVCRIGLSHPVLTWQLGRVCICLASGLPHQEDTPTHPRPSAGTARSWVPAVVCCQLSEISSILIPHHPSLAPTPPTVLTARRSPSLVLSLHRIKTFPDKFSLACILAPRSPLPFCEKSVLLYPPLGNQTPLSGLADILKRLVWAQP